MEGKCNSILDSIFILNILKEKKDIDLIKKFNKFKLRQEIEKIPNHVFCPYKNCEGFSFKEKDNKFLKCNKGHKFCSDCKFEGWHKGTKCGEDEKKDMELFVQWKKNHNVKICPNCQAPIEKNEGCNHMTCINCKYEFCWLCNQKYTPEHFNNGRCRQFDREENNLPENIAQIMEREERNNIQRNNDINNNENICCIFLLFAFISSCCSNFCQCLKDFCQCFWSGFKDFCECFWSCIIEFFKCFGECLEGFCKCFDNCIKGLCKCIDGFCKCFE